MFKPNLHVGPTTRGVRQRSSILGDHQVSQIPGVLIGLYLDLLRLLVYLQLARRQHRARALAVGREDQLDRTDAVVSGTCTPVQLAERKGAIGDETESSPFVRGQFHDVLDIVAHTPTGESDSTLRLHVLEDIYKTVLTRAFECID